MRLLLALAVLLASPPAVQAQGAGQTITEPEWLRKPSGEDLANVWPAAAARRSVDGDATIACEVSALGLLEDCKVAEESPVGLGFGDAALLLAPRFQMKPATIDGRPVGGAHVRVPIKFVAEGPLYGKEVTTIRNPVWSAAPTHEQMAKAWPWGNDKLPAGHVVLRCRTTKDGGLDDCELIGDRDRHGFGFAAKSLAGRFRLDQRAYDQSILGSAYVDVPLHFLNPASPQPATVDNPVWVVGLDPNRMNAVFPDAAAAAGLRRGRGVTECTVAAGGALLNCRPVPSPTDQHGFGVAAALVASVMQMNPWTEGGRPVGGARIRLPIVFQLAPEEQPRP